MSENPSFAVEGYEAGVSGFILKPFIGRRVVETVRRLA
jgi:DNA-binding NarL/FixJ family response regulator